MTDPLTTKDYDELVSDGPNYQHDTHDEAPDAACSCGGSNPDCALCHGSGRVLQEDALAGENGGDR